MRFRPGQDEVAAYTGGMLAVPAVPGAGKTTVLSWLAARIISEGLPRGAKVLVVTVMNSAVANFTRKIGDWLEGRNLPRGWDLRSEPFTLWLCRLFASVPMPPCCGMISPSSMAAIGTGWWKMWLTAGLPAISSAGLQS